MASEPLKVLLIDDEPAVVHALGVLLDLHHIPHVGAGTPDEALGAVRLPDVGVVVQDMNFRPAETSGEEGVDLFRRIRALRPEVPVLLMTAWASLETAVHLVKEGAADYVAKPWDDEKLVVTIRNLLRIRRLELENLRLQERNRRAREDLGAGHDLCGMVYESAEMQAVTALALQVAASDAPVLITGPSGVGKEKLAEIIHANSRRASRPLLRVNVGAIPQELMESELFGAEAGAFTGATGRRTGHFEAADGGTLFLDEIDALPLAGQVKLLRVVQTGEFQRLGSSRTHRTDARLVSATNTDLRAAVVAGRFREDLYFRLNVIELAVPPLARRADDVLPLARHFLRRHAGEAGRASLTLAPGAEQALLAHPWEGNVRELENCIRRAALTAAGTVVSAEDLGLDHRPAPAPDGAPPPPAGPVDAERRRIERALTEAGGVVTRAAGALGLSRQALYRRMERLGIVLERRPRP